MLGENRPEVKLKLETYKRFPEIADRIEGELQFMMVEEGYDIADPPLFHFPRDRKTEGILVGYGVYNGKNLGPLYERPEVFTKRNVLYLGESREGKTFATANIISQIPKYEPDRTIIIYDRESEYAGLLGNFFGPEKLIRIHYSDYKRSMFENIEHYQDEWIGILKRIWQESQYVGDTIQIFARIVKKLCSKTQILARGGYPTLSEVLYHINKQKLSGKLFQYQQTLSSRVADSTIFLGPIFETTRGFTWDDFKGKIVAIDMFGMDETANLLFMNFELMDIKFYMKSHPDARMTIVLDELHSFCPFRKGELFKPILLYCIKTLLKRDVNFHMNEQNASSVRQEIFGNAPTKSVFKTQDERDRRPIKSSLNLDKEQDRELALLPRQHCLYLSETLDEAVPIKIPDLRLVDKTQEVIEWSEPFIKESHSRFRERIRGNSKIEVSETTHREAIPAMDDAEIVVLRTIAEKPFLKKSEYASILNLPMPTFNRITSSLASLGLVEEYRVNPGGKGGSFSSLWITENGCESAGLDYAEVSSSIKGKGSREHVALQNRIVTKLNRRGIPAEVEGNINGKNADIKVIQDGKVYAWEIELNVESGNRQIIKNIIDDLNRGADSVRVLVRNKRDMETLWEILDKHVKETNDYSLKTVLISLINEYM